MMVVFLDICDGVRLLVVFIEYVIGLMYGWLVVGVWVLVVCVFVCWFVVVCVRFDVLIDDELLLLYVVSVSVMVDNVLSLVSWLWWIWWLLVLFLFGFIFFFGFGYCVIKVVNVCDMCRLFCYLCCMVGSWWLGIGFFRDWIWYRYSKLLVRMVFGCVFCSLVNFYMIKFMIL